MEKISKLISLLRVLYLQGMMLMGWKPNKGSFQIGKENKVEVNFKLVALKSNEFTFELDKTPGQIVFQLADGSREDFVLSMCRVEMALWLQNQFLLLPPKFSVSKPQENRVYANLI